MKKYFIGLVLFSFGLVFFVAGSRIAAAGQASRIGVAAGIAGEVRAVSLRGEERLLKSGDSLFQGDTVSTGENSKMQILLLDETVFTIGSASSIRLDEFVYDPSTSEGKVNADILKGAFRFISGKIAHKRPENMSLDLPAGSIGVRGTFAAGQSEGQRSLVVLLGGPDGQNSGAIHVSNDVNGQPVGVDINRGGFGTVIEGDNSPPLPPFQVPAQDLMNLANALGQQLTPGTSQQESGHGGSGLPEVDAQGQIPPNVNDLLNMLSTVDNLNQQLQTAAQGAAQDAGSARQHSQDDSSSTSSTSGNPPITPP